MRNGCFLALAVVLVFGAAAEAQVRGNGDGRRGVGTRLRDRADNIRSNFGNGPLGQDLRDIGKQLQGELNNEVKNGDVVNKLNSLLGGGILQQNQQLNANFKAGQEPFTPAWYAQHPRAWQFSHPHADAWAAVTFGTAAAWLGINAATGPNAATGGSVYTSDTTPQQSVENEQAAQDLASEQSPSADGFEAAGGGKFLPLGVFGLAPLDAQDATAVVQLAVSEQGELRGNYVDMLTGQDQSISGSIDKTTQKAQFQVGADGKLSFETTLWNLTQPAAPVTLRLANGQTRQLTLARVDQPAADSNQPASSNGSTTR